MELKKTFTGAMVTRLLPLFSFKEREKYLEFVLLKDTMLLDRSLMSEGSLMSDDDLNKSLLKFFLILTDMEVVSKNI